MRRETLSPPTAVTIAHPAPAAGDPGLPHVPLGPPGSARSIPRRLFDPVRGWFRRAERATSFFLSRHLFPRVPGIERLYAPALGHRLTVADADIPIPGLPRSFEGIGILLVTDLHLGPFLDAGALRGAFARLRTLEPDLVLLGGDFITTRNEELLPHAEAFRELRAPLGVHGVLGNHDHYGGDVAALRRTLASYGVRILHNEPAALERNGERLALAGIDDWNAGCPDLPLALRGAAAVGGPVLLLSHNPDVAFDAARRGVALVLSGHTHGGQVRLPGVRVLVRMSRYRLDEGRYRAGETEIVVSRGLGVSGLPLRVGCPPEAVFLRLRGSR